MLFSRFHEVKTYTAFYASLQIENRGEYRAEIYQDQNFQT